MQEQKHNNEQMPIEQRPAAIAANQMLGVRFVKHDDENLNSLIGKRMAFDYWDIMQKCNLHYIDVGQNDKVDFYGNKDIDLCLRFVEDWDDDVMVLELTDVFRYPELYEKSNEEINNDLIHANAMGLAIKKEIESLLSTGKGIDDNTFTDCQIDAYEKLRNEGRLKF